MKRSELEEIKRLIVLCVGVCVCVSVPYLHNDAR